MNTHIDFKCAIARWPQDGGQDLATWRRKIHDFCDAHDIFSREELLGGQALWVWGRKDKLAIFKLFHC